MATGIKMGNEEKTPLTDKNGNFELTGENGYFVEIKSIEKRGYKLSEKFKRSYAYSWSGDIFHPDSTNPVVFKMWKKMGGQQLVQTTKLVVAKWDGNVSCDGATNRFDLLSGRESTDGDLEIICTRVPFHVLPRENKRFDYKIEINIIGGGIQATKDEFTYLARENGYLPSYSLSQKAEDTNWHGRFKQEFYIKTASGHHGTLSVDWYSSQDSPTHLDWNCSINPSGSRNLER